MVGIRRMENYGRGGLIAPRERTPPNGEFGYLMKKNEIAGEVLI